MHIKWIESILILNFKSTLIAHLNKFVMDSEFYRCLKADITNSFSFKCIYARLEVGLTLGDDLLFFLFLM